MTTPIPAENLNTGLQIPVRYNFTFYSRESANIIPDALMAMREKLIAEINSEDYTIHEMLEKSRDLAIVDHLFSNVLDQMSMAGI